MASVNNNNDNNDASDERDAKRLRSSEPDLKVILGSGDEETVQWYHSQTLASKSKYIDTMLAVPMREREDRVISFPDIEPDVWEKMIKFLDNPIAARGMNAKDAVEVAAFYDKYEFVDGRELCSLIMMDYMSDKSIHQMEKRYTLDIDMITDLVIVAHKANMDDIFKQGMKYILNKMNSTEIPYGSLMFTESQLEKLRPVLKYAKECRYEGCSPPPLVRALLDSSIEQSNFPKEFIQVSQQSNERDLLRNCISHIELSGAGCADGSYKQTDGKYWEGDRYEQVDEHHGGRREGRWDGVPVSYWIQYWELRNDVDLQQDQDNFVGWSIVRRYPAVGPFDEDGDVDHASVLKKKCWIAPHSTNLKYPPLKGWIPYDQTERGKPTMEYILEEKVVDGGVYGYAGQTIM